MREFSRIKGMVMKKLWWVALCWLASVTAHAAPQVLFLSPDESKPVGRPVAQADWSFTNNAYNAFSAQVGAANIHDGRRVLDSASPDLTLFNGVQLVVITTTYAVISPQWQAELRTLMLNRPDLTFVFYPDGCCNSGQNLTPIVDIIKTGTSWGVSVTGTNVAGAVNAALNTNSLYKGSFAGLPTMVGGDYQLVYGVPSDNALYVQNAASVPPAGSTTAVNAYGFFVPQQGFNGGNGSCIFLTADISPFKQGTQPQQSNAIAAAFVDAATNPNGACKQATRAPDLTVTLAGPSTLDIGTPGTFTLTIGNQGASKSPDGKVVIPLPAGFTVSNLQAGCSVVGSDLSCDLPELAATTGTTTLVFEGASQQSGNVTLTATIQSVTGETNTANNTANHSLVVQVPDLSVTWISANTGTVGVNQPFSLQVNNAGPGASQPSVLTVTVPADVTVDPTSVPPSCTLSGATLSCQVPALAVGANTSIGFTAKPTAAGTSNLVATVSNVIGETNASNNSATLALQANNVPVQPSVTPVPSLGAWALALLAVLVGAVPALRRRMA